MWHETKDEMIEFLKSILRMDEDQCARRVAQKYLRVVDPDYYEFESRFQYLGCNFYKDQFFFQICIIIFSSNIFGRCFRNF